VYSGPGAADRAVDHAAAAAAVVDSNTGLSARHCLKTSFARPNATLSPTYMQGPFRELLEQRIREASDNAAAFNATDANAPASKPMMVDSSVACVACHQNRACDSAAG